MVRGNRDFTSFFHEFCSWLRFFCSWLLSLCCIFFAWQEKRDLLSFFLRLVFTAGYFLFNSVLSLSLSKEKSGFVVKTKRQGKTPGRVLYRKRDPNVEANGVPNFHKAPISDSIKIRGQFFSPKIPGGYLLGII